MHAQTVEPTRAFVAIESPDKLQNLSCESGQSQPQSYLRFSMALYKFHETLRGLGKVKKIGFKARGESISVWTFADDPSPDILNKIYAAEMDFMNALPHILFDFAVKFDDSREAPGSFIIMV